MLKYSFLVCALSLLLACGGNTLEPKPSPVVAKIDAVRINHARFKLLAKETADDFTYQWTINDGTKLSNKSVEHSFGSAGEHSIELMVTNAAGDSATDAVKVYVKNSMPVAAYRLRHKGLELEFNAQTSFDVDNNIAQYLWTIDGQSFEGAVVKKTFLQSKEIDFDLTVIDDFGLVSETISDVAVINNNENTIPEVLIDTIVNKNYVRLFGGNSGDTERDYLDYTWRLSDGSEHIGDMVIHAFAQVGDYTITLIVDDGEAKAESSVEVSITELHEPDKAYKKDIFEASLFLFGRCAYCHQNTEPVLDPYTDLDKVDSELTNIILTRSPFWLYSFPSEENGLVHSGVIPGAPVFVEAGDKVAADLALWRRLVKNLASYLNLDASDF